MNAISNNKTESLTADASRTLTMNTTEENVEVYSSLALLILCSLLVGVLWLSYYLQSRRVRLLHETVVAILAGILVGVGIKLSGVETLQRIVTFDDAVFFNLLLPPVIFNSGYDLNPKDFFRNFGPILAFAFCGTFTTAAVVAALVYLVNLIGLAGIEMSATDCMGLGAIISATDPVTILAVFQQLGVEPNLYAVILGESMLNDAVAIVLYGTINQFRGHELHMTNIIRAIGVFLGIFFGSLAIGVFVGLGCSLILKHSGIYRYPSIETCIVLLMAYITYLFSNACSLSGIVSLLFCGITLRYYAYHNMSLHSRHTTRYMTHVMSQLSENFIFIYLGITLFTQKDGVFRPLFILCVMVFVCVARYIAVFPLAKVINFVSCTLLRQQREPLPETYQVMLFWAGLRGAVAFALATSLTGSSASAIRTTILCVVVLSVLIFGGTTATVINRLGIRTGIHRSNSRENDASSSETDDEDGGDDEYDIETEGTTSYAQISDDDQQQSWSQSGAQVRRVNSHRRHWWSRVDERWLQPLFIRKERAQRIRKQRRSRIQWQQHTRHQPQIRRSANSESNEQFYNESGPGRNVTTRPLHDYRKQFTSRTTRVFGQHVATDSNYEESDAYDASTSLYPQRHVSTTSKQARITLANTYVDSPGTRRSKKTKSKFAMSSDNDTDDALPKWRARNNPHNTQEPAPIIAEHTPEDQFYQYGSPRELHISKTTNTKQSIARQPRPPNNNHDGGNNNADDDEPPLIYIDEVSS
ncbi:Sodium/hydrogen exchanger family-domain-containing protein [Syncephalis fuscata]|nr:Sodium/hydrogen exchanger family-domain-containing protein [Syncephalis fuscata]